MGSYALVQPADFMYLQRGVPSLFECKQIKKKGVKSFELRYINEVQHEILMDWWRERASAWYLLNDRTTPRAYKCYAVDGLLMEALLANDERKSIKWTELEQCAVDIERVRGGLWDLSVLVNSKWTNNDISGLSTG